MQTSVTILLQKEAENDFKATINEIINQNTNYQIIAIGSPSKTDVANIQFINGETIYSTSTLKEAAKIVSTNYILLYTKTLPLQLGYQSIKRMVSICQDTQAGMVYSDYYKTLDGQLKSNPVIDYQDGSLRDDFDFGSLVLIPTEKFKSAVSQMDVDYNFAAIYDLRLKILQSSKLFHIAEYLYTEKETDTRQSGQKMFDYVDPRNRNRQIEMEQACTDHLKKVGAFLKPVFKEIEFSSEPFEYEATVIIPVKNRVKTIGDAIESLLKQETPFKFNIIIVNNHSTDGTTELVENYANTSSKVVHLVPERTDLGIGGCWLYGANHDRCGKFIIQLDSDDLYINNNVINTIVEAFYEQKCGMVIGSYQMVNFDLQPIPPGLIDHKEWTPTNGRNNALRINGLGAPRAFYTPLLREIGIPNVSYGEDYALGLRICREYQIGRIYEPLYLCRRWDGNSDAALDIVKMNAHNLYKDKIRTIELLARLQLNSNKQ